MHQTESAQPARIGASHAIPTGDDLRSWDWRDELRRQERSLGWLGRHTNRSTSAVSRYASGSLTPPEDWLEDVARALGMERAA